MLSRKGNTLAFKSQEDDKTKYFPVENVSEIKIFGEVDLNKRVLEFVSSNNIPIHFYNYHGFYIGSFYPYEHNTNGMTIVKQVEHYLSEKKRLILAKKFIEGAMRNMLKIVEYYERRSENQNPRSYREKLRNFSTIG